MNRTRRDGNIYSTTKTAKTGAHLTGMPWVFDENRIWHCAFLSHDLYFRGNEFTQTNKHINIICIYQLWYEISKWPFQPYVLKCLPSRTNKIDSTWIPQILFFAVALRDFPPVWEHSEKSLRIKIIKTYCELIDIDSVHSWKEDCMGCTSTTAKNSRGGGKLCAT